MFTNFIASLYQAFLYGDKRPGDSLLLGEGKDDNTASTAIVENSDHPQHTVHDHDLKDVLEHVEKQKLTMDQRIWLLKRQETLKNKIAQKLKLDVDNLPK